MRPRRFALAFCAVAAAGFYAQVVIYAANRGADPEIAPAVPQFVDLADPVPRIALPPLPSPDQARPAATAATAEFRDAPAVVEPETARIDAPALDNLLREEPAIQAPRPQLAGLTPGPATAPRLREKPDAPWRANAVPFDDRPGLRLISIIIDDAGLNRAGTVRAIRLPAPLTIAFLPYAPDLPRQADEARKRGHELMLHVPMEPISPFENPGPDALTTWLARDEVDRRLTAAIGRFNGFVGINNHMGSRMTLDVGAMLPILEQVRDRGLLFVDSRTIGGSVAGPLADRLGIPGAARDVFIDHEDDPGAVAARLDDIERIARRQGQAVAIGHPHERTLDALERWLPGLSARGFTLAPVSAVALRRRGAGDAASR